LTILPLFITSFNDHANISFNLLRSPPNPFSSPDPKVKVAILQILTNKKGFKRSSSLENLAYLEHMFEFLFFFQF